MPRTRKNVFEELGAIFYYGRKIKEENPKDIVEYCRKKSLQE